MRRLLLSACLLSAVPAHSLLAQESPRELNTLPSATPPVTTPAAPARGALPDAPPSPEPVPRPARPIPASPGVPSRFAVGLKNGQQFQVYDVAVKQPVFGRAFLLLDGQQRLDLSEVRYYEDETGHYVRTTLPRAQRETTLRRDRRGRLSLYSTVGTQFAGNNFGYPYGGGGFGAGGFGPTYRTVRTEYFSKDNGPIENMNLRNLVAATSDNPASSALLTQARRYQTYTTLSYVAAGGLILLGLYSHATPNQERRTISPLFYAGIPFLIVPLVLQGKQRTSMRQAITTYNKEEG